MSKKKEAEVTDIVVAEPAAQMTVWGASTPTEVVSKMTAVADAMKDVLKNQGLTKRIGDKDYVLVEGWTLVGSMTGIFPVTVWTRELPYPDEMNTMPGRQWGYEARVEARWKGEVVGAAEAMCTRGEKMWAGRDDYALRSMAQTRATSKALRQPLGMVATLAGYQATPAEEMPANGDFEKKAEKTESSVWKGNANVSRETSVKAQAPLSTDPVIRKDLERKAMDWFVKYISDKRSDFNEFTGGCAAVELDWLEEIGLYRQGAAQDGIVATFMRKVEERKAEPIEHVEAVPVDVP